MLLKLYHYYPRFAGSLVFQFWYPSAMLVLLLTHFISDPTLFPPIQYLASSSISWKGFYIIIFFFKTHAKNISTYLHFSPNIHPISFCVWFSQRNVLSITPPFSLIIRHLLVRNDIAVFRCIRGSRFLHSSTANVFENKVSKNEMDWNQK